MQPETDQREAIIEVDTTLRFQASLTLLRLPGGRLTSELLERNYYQASTLLCGPNFEARAFLCDMSDCFMMR